MKDKYISLKPYLLLWSTQTLSALGSGMTSYALVLWLYLCTGSALFAVIGVCGVAVCAVFGWLLRKYRWSESKI